MLRRALTRTSEWLLALAAGAAVLALLVASHAIAERSDLVLAALVLFTALGIAPAELASLTGHKAQLAVLVAAPFVALVPLSLLISRLFSGAVRDGTLASAWPRPRSLRSGSSRWAGAALCWRSAR